MEASELHQKIKLLAAACAQFSALEGYAAVLEVALASRPVPLAFLSALYDACVAALADAQVCSRPCLRIIIKGGPADEWTFAVFGHDSGQCDVQHATPQLGIHGCIRT